MKRILIVYETRYGSTKTIAQCIAQGATRKGIDVTVQNVADADPGGFDLVVIGSPIYEEHPLPSVINFLVEHHDLLSKIDVALFVVCVDYGVIPKEELIRRYTSELQASVAGRIVATEVFGGYLDIDKLSALDRKLIEEFAKMVGVPVTTIDKLDQESARKFGVQLTQFLEPTAAE